MTAKPEAPHTFDDLRSAIAESYPVLRGQMRLIAEYIIANPDEVALSTITAVAAKIGVQPSSMVRFAKSFGRDGYTDLQKLFRSQLIASSPSYAQRIRALSDAGAEGRVTGDLLSEFVDQGIAALQMLRDETPQEKLGEAADLIAGAGDVYLLAQRRAFPVAFYISYALARLELRSILLGGVGGLLSDQAALARPGDVIVAVSFKPYTPDVVELVQERSAAGVDVISITDSVLSPIQSGAKVSFEVREQEKLEFRTLVAPMCLAQALVVAVGHRLAGKGGGN